MNNHPNEKIVHSKYSKYGSHPPVESRQASIIQSLTAAVTVSFVALSLGAAFGVLSGRGATAGMMSSAIMASLTSLLGGTRIQCSGPTGPMTTVTATIVGFAGSVLLIDYPSANPEHFINLVLILVGVLLLLSSILKLGKFIHFIPHVVISGFMNGIAVLIWIDQLQRLFGFGGKRAYEGGLLPNLIVLLTTAFLVFTIPLVTRRFLPKLASLLSGTLLAIVILTTATSLFGVDVERVSLGSPLRSFDDFANLVSSQVPLDWSTSMILVALPFAIQLSILAYLDTLMTALVIDKMTGETTKPNQELGAQAMSHAAVAFVGGIAGAQATIRSVLMVKEGAAWRWAGVLVGVFAMIEMLLLQDWIKLIPQAVFAGILMKVGYDVFDWAPVRIYFTSLFDNNAPPRQAGIPFVQTIEILIIFGTALVTVFWNLNVAVASFTGLFYLHNLVLNPQNPINDLHYETEGFSDEE